MSNTLVIQSHTQPLPATWIQTCLDSVKHWAGLNQFDYRFYGDELFACIDPSLLEKLSKQLVIATDLARLRLLQHHLQQSYQTVIWCDADFLIFSPEKFRLPNEEYALGREIWIQNKSDNKLISKTKVHNAFMMYRHNNHFLNFYTETAERLLMLNKGTMSPQFIGPKLLSALHNIAQCPVAEHAGMLSPIIIRDICMHGGPALDLLLEQSKHPIYGANLCSSLYYQEEFTQQQIETCITTLLNNNSHLLDPKSK